MRIAGYIEHQKYKITLLHMNNRYDIKIEFMGLEQHYKIRETDYFNTPNRIKESLTPEFFSKVDLIFDQMLANQNLILAQDNHNNELDYLTGVI